MADKSAIEWTDATWNPTVGCSIVSPGCTNCYAMKVANGLERRFDSPKYRGLTKVVNGNAVWTGEVRLDEAALLQPLKWKRGRRIFVNSMSDLFHESLSDADIDRVFAVMALAPQHTFQVLTKRAERMRDYFAPRGATAVIARPWMLLERYYADKHHGCVTLLGIAGLASPQRLARRLRRTARGSGRAHSALLQTPAAVRFVSLEPLLGPIDFALRIALHRLRAVHLGRARRQNLAQATACTRARDRLGDRWWRVRKACPPDASEMGARLSARSM
jgi:protein gp37